MSILKDCPFCGDIHARVVTRGKRTLVECRGCECRGPSHENLSDKQSTWNVNEAAARWNKREPRP